MDLTIVAPQMSLRPDSNGTMKRGPKSKCTYLRALPLVGPTLYSTDAGYVTNPEMSPEETRTIQSRYQQLQQLINLSKSLFPAFHQSEMKKMDMKAREMVRYTRLHTCFLPR